MSYSRLLIIMVSVFSVPCSFPVPLPAQGTTYHLGRTPSQKEIQAEDISIGPDGKELPPGSGTAQQGAKIYALKCALCHGKTGAEGPASQLSGPDPEMKSWPVATTIWDYINRDMPWGREKTLKPDEVYALTALMLYWSGIVQENTVLDAKTLPKIQMPRRNRYVPPKPEWKPGVPRPPYGIYP